MIGSDYNNGPQTPIKLVEERGEERGSENLVQSVCSLWVPHGPSVGVVHLEGVER